MSAAVQFNEKFAATFSAHKIAQMHVAYLVDTQDEDTAGLTQTIDTATATTAGISSVQTIMGAKADRDPADTSPPPASARSSRRSTWARSPE